MRELEKLERIWREMRRRCEEPSHLRWAQYGGRGITVCARWQDFEAFLSDMGPRPVGYQIDRIDNSLGYSPGNCRWATVTENANNRRNNRLLVVGERALTMAQWSRVVGIRPKTIQSRLRSGWSVEKAVLTPKLTAV